MKIQFCIFLYVDNELRIPELDHTLVHLSRMLRISADVKNSEKCQTYANRILTKCKEYQNIQTFAFLLHLQAYSDILQIFLPAFPAEFLEFHRMCPRDDSF